MRPRIHWDGDGKATGPKYSSVVEHEMITSYQIRTKILSSQILWLKQFLRMFLFDQSLFTKSFYLPVNFVYVMLFLGLSKTKDSMKF